MKKAIAAVLGAAALGTTLVACSSNETATSTKEPFTLNGAGASFPAMLYQNWFQSFAQDTGNPYATLAEAFVQVDRDTEWTLVSEIEPMIIGMMVAATIHFYAVFLF